MCWDISSTCITIPMAIPPASRHDRRSLALGSICTPSKIRSIPSLRALSMVAKTPASTALHVSCQSRTASPDSPRENEERCSAGDCEVSTTRIISLIASVERSLANECSFAILTAVVDLPTPVAPAIRTRIGGRPVTLVVVASAIPILFAIRPCCSCWLIKTTPNGRGFEAVPSRPHYDERTDVDCWRVV